MKRRIELALMIGVVMVSGLAANERKLAKNVARRIPRGTDGKGTANETGRVEMILPPTALKVARFGHSSKGLAHVKNGAETQAACRQSSSRSPATMPEMCKSRRWRDGTPAVFRPC